jgi:hypothetical protein
VAQAQYGMLFADQEALKSGSRIWTYMSVACTDCLDPSWTETGDERSKGRETSGSRQANLHVSAG